MSKIGRMPITIPSGVTVSVTGTIVTIGATKGTITYSIPQGILVAVADGKIVVTQKNPGEETTRALFGLARATLANMLQGITKGFVKKLELSGVGYRAQISGTDLLLSVGFTHQVKVPAPKGITFTVAESIITVSGDDPALVGNTAAQIRSIRKPEPYKGKGIKYVNEKIRRKAGKAAKAVGGAAK